MDRDGFVYCGTYKHRKAALRLAREFFRSERREVRAARRFGVLLEPLRAGATSVFVSGMDRMQRLPRHICFRRAAAALGASIGSGRTPCGRRPGSTNTPTRFKRGKLRAFDRVLRWERGRSPGEVSADAR
jgi:hypothetical protein